MFQDRSTGPRPVCLILIEDFCPNSIGFGTVVREENSILSFAGHFVQSWGKVCEILKLF